LSGRHDGCSRVKETRETAAKCIDRCGANDFPYGIPVNPVHFLIYDYLQDITGVLRTLKKDFQVNEAVLRVGVPYPNLLFRLRLMRMSRRIGEQGGIGCGQASFARYKGSRRPCEGNCEKMEERG